MERVVGLATIEAGYLSAPYTDPSLVATLVHEALLQAGLGRVSSAAPLVDMIEPGMTVLIKPNWVSDFNEAGFGTDCLVTAPNVLLAVLREVIVARPGRIIIGDAPVQGCKWEQLVTQQLREEVEKVSKDIQCELVDFRRAILHNHDLGVGTSSTARTADQYVLFDLASDSLLEPVSRPPGRFRVTMYDPRALAKTHYPGRHQYILCREALEANIILNLPKLKTHRKAGFSGALKNLVGLNGNKEYLPHHRVGGTSWGGDCYQGMAPLKRLAEVCLDIANRHIGSPVSRSWSKLAFRLLAWHAHFGDAEIEGSWYGNDTIWRMVLDLNRILRYGKPDGSMAPQPQRRIWSLTDALVCGEGEGPLSPAPCFVGAVTFSESPVAADFLHAALLKLDPSHIPLLNNALQDFRWPLLPSHDSISVFHKGTRITLAEVAERYGVDVALPKGWTGYRDPTGVRK